MHTSIFAVRVRGGLSRRVAQALFAGAVLMHAPVVRAAHGDERATITVMTQNVYIGTNFVELRAAKTVPDFVGAVTITYQNILATRPLERMAAVAREIARARPDVVALQEAAIVRTGTGPIATHVEVDLVAAVVAALARQGADYTVVALLPGLDAQAPSTLGFNVRFTLEDAILVRSERRGFQPDVSNLQVQHYLRQLVVPTAAGPFTNPAGWASVDLRVHGTPFRFVTTHLTVANGVDVSVPLAQAQELVQAATDTAWPVVMAGDFNAVASDPTHPTYAIYQQLLDAGFNDAWTEARPGVPGFTCCQDQALTNVTSQLTQRLDLALVRGNLTTTGAAVLDRMLLPPAFPIVWRSDHGGVLVTLQPRH
jgi:endonuclease/exonuclease/phosphatase family metal-dependent hydrolase